MKSICEKCVGKKPLQGPGNRSRGQKPGCHKSSKEGGRFLYNVDIKLPLPGRFLPRDASLPSRQAGHGSAAFLLLSALSPEELADVPEDDDQHEDDRYRSILLHQGLDVDLLGLGRILLGFHGELGGHVCHPVQPLPLPQHLLNASTEALGGLPRRIGRTSPPRTWMFLVMIWCTSLRSSVSSCRFLCVRVSR